MFNGNPFAMAGRFIEALLGPILCGGYLRGEENCGDGEKDAFHGSSLSWRTDASGRKREDARGRFVRASASRRRGAARPGRFRGGLGCRARGSLRRCKASKRHGYKRKRRCERACRPPEQLQLNWL